MLFEKGLVDVDMYILPIYAHYPFSSGRVLVDGLPNFIVNGESVTELLFFLLSVFPYLWSIEYPRLFSIYVPIDRAYP